MQLHSFADLGNGRISYLNSTLTRTDGSTLVWPTPLLLLDHNVAAALTAHVNELDQVVTDLDSWLLHDLDRGRDLGITVAGAPTTREVLNLVDRYATEARRLSAAQLADWRERVVGLQK